MLIVYIVLALTVWYILAECADWLDENVVDWHNRKDNYYDK